MSTNYPGGLDSYSTKTDGVDDVLAAHINDPQDAIEAIETLLGTYAQNVEHANLFINGGFDIWQRTTDDTGVTTTRKYVADRWAFKTSAGTLAHVQQSTTIRSGFRAKYSCQLDGAAGVGTVDIDQRIEAAMAGLYRRTVTFLAWIYNGSGAAFTPKLFVSTPSAADNWTTSTVRNGGGLGEDLQECADGQWTWVQWSANIGSYTDITNGVEFRLQIPSGSLVAGDTVRLMEMTLVPGEKTVFEQRPIQQEIALCQRYYEKSYPLTVEPGTGNQASAYARGATTVAIGSLDSFKVIKRTTPTIRIWSYNGVANDVSVWLSSSDIGASLTNKYSTVNKITTLSVSSGTPFSVGSWYWFNWDADAEL